MAAFDRITVEDGLQLRLSLSAGEATEVVVTFDDNLLEHIETTVRDGTLEIRVDGELSADGGGRFVSVVVGELSSVEASGGARR